MYRDKKFWDRWKRTAGIRSKASAPFRLKLRPNEIKECQEIALLKAIDKFDPTRAVAFETFLWTLVQNECRRVWKRKLRPIRSERKVYFEPRSTYEPLSDEVDYKRWQNDKVAPYIHSLLQDLAKEDLAIIRDKFWNGLSLQEIADKYGLTNVMAASRRIKAILERLGKLTESDREDFRERKAAPRCKSETSSHKYDKEDSYDLD